MKRSDICGQMIEECNERLISSTKEFDRLSKSLGLASCTSQSQLASCSSGLLADGQEARRSQLKPTSSCDENGPRGRSLFGKHDSRADGTASDRTSGSALTWHAARICNVPNGYTLHRAYSAKAPLFSSSASPISARRRRLRQLRHVIFSNVKRRRYSSS